MFLPSKPPREKYDGFETAEFGISFCVSKTEQEQNHVCGLERRGTSTHVAESVELEIRKERPSR